MERLTIESPRLGSELDCALLLSVGSPIGLIPSEAKPGVPSPKDALFLDLASNFQGELVLKAWEPIPRDHEAIQEYEDLVDALRTLRPPGKSLRKVLEGFVAKGGRLVLAGHSYLITHGFLDKLSTAAPPFEVTHHLMADKWGANPRAVRERLAKARIEQRILRAWAKYGSWLEAHLDALNEIGSLLNIRIYCPSSLLSPSIPL